ncbi:MAG: DNA repair protein RecN, partial [Acidimicrobiales bacterium]
VARSVPATGRSRGWVNGRMATVAALAELGNGLVDLHGQHAHQSLLAQASQRDALDAYGGIDLGPLARARQRVAALEEALAGLGGDARARAREEDLLRYQVAELDGIRISGPDEYEQLGLDQEALSSARSDRDALDCARAALEGGEGIDGAGPGVLDAVATALAALSKVAPSSGAPSASEQGGRPDVTGLEERLRSVMAEIGELCSDLRRGAESIEDDPQRLAEVIERRTLLKTMMRKYGDTMADVLAFADRARRSLDDLDRRGDRVAQLEGEREVARAELDSQSDAVRLARQRAAPGLAGEVAAHLARLAMERARFEVTVGDAGSGDDVCFMLGANPGEPPLPLNKVASGGELARAMLATRLVLMGEPRTLVFDEVDAGIGGEAALAVGRALAELAHRHQVLVVTHLPQVAAFADSQVSVTKSEVGGRTLAEARTLSGPDRVVELSRMLSGQPGSAKARDHAKELLAAAAEIRWR